MLIDVHVSLYRCDRVVSVDACTLRVEVERLQSDPSTLYYKLVGTTDQGRLLIRSSENAQEMLDLYDSYMSLADEKYLAALDMADAGGDPD
mgnify:FL=1